MGGTALLKVFFFICPPVAELHSPSGHTSLSTLVYGALVMLVAATIGSLRYSVIGAGGILVLVIAASRVALHSHTALETGAGLVVGAVALGVFARSYLASERAQASLRPLLLSVALLLVLLHGRQLHAEGMLRAFGTYLQETSGICKAGPNAPG
jgi:membrane-associated phospholipid phosphatase